MTSLLMQSLTEGPLANFVPWIGIIVFLYIAYLVYWKKNSKMIELLTTQKIIVPILFLIGIGAVGAGTVALVFGGLSPVIMVIVQLISPILIAMLVHSAMAWIIKNFTDYF